MSDFSQLPSKTVTEVLMLEVSLKINLKIIKNILHKFNLCKDENVACSKNIFNFWISTFNA